MNETVSIIIPLYNSGEYLPNLLKSLTEQTYKDIEIICVDDGSTDNSAEIIRDFMKKDDRISYYYQENSGGGAARNLGIIKAKGEYLICLDSDDLYEKTLVEYLYTKAKKTDADIVICKYNVCYQTTERLSRNKGVNTKILPQKEVFSADDVENILNVTNCAPWNRLYKSDFILKNDLKYSTSRIINDLKFGMIALILAKKVTTVDKELSTYRYQIAGSGSKNREKKLANSLLVYMEIYDEFCERGLWEKYKNLYFNQIIESLKYEISFPISPMTSSLIKGFLFKHESFASLSPDEIQKLFNIKQIKRNYINYLLLSTVCLGLNETANERYQQFKNKLLNLKNIGVIGIER